MLALLRRPSAHLLLAIAACAVAAGCDTGSHTKTTTTNPTTNVPVNVVTIANPSSANLGTVINALIFQLVNNGSVDVRLQAVTVQASGTVDDVATIHTVTLVEDLDSSATVNAGDRAIAANNPGFSVDNGTSVLTVPTGTTSTIPRGSVRQFVVSLETIGNAGQVAHVGSTVTLAITAAASIAASTTQTGTTIQFNNLPTSATAVTIGVGTHLLISEVCTDETGEFIEIFNPTGGAIDLSNFHLTDCSDTVIPLLYHRLPTGTQFGPVQTNTTTQDFSVRFPNAATIAPGAFQTIARDGGVHQTKYSQTATYCLRGAVNGTTQMRTWDGVGTNLNFTQTAIATTLTLLPATGEPVYLFTWNGQATGGPPDLVTDVDIVVYGNATAIAGTDVPSFKGAVAQDGIDTNTATSTYPNETAAATQNTNRFQATAAQVSIQRNDFLEGSETQTGGNGFGGDDETSENWNTTFVGATVATPGAR